MPQTSRCLISAVAMVLLCLEPAMAEASVQRSFDLVCLGSMQDGAAAAGAPFTLRIRVDVKHMRFCDDDYCGVLDKINAKVVESHCDAKNGGRFCNAAAITSTAGPFVDDDDFTVDLSTGKIQRTTSGMAGDRVARPFHKSFTGRCRVRPFTHLQPPRPRTG